MVTIKNFKPIQTDDGDTFYALIVEGGVETVRSQRTGRIYFTTRTSTVPTIFDEATCKAAIGTSFNGTIKKVPCDPYEYTIKDTGETIMLDYRWEYVDDTLELVERQVVKETETIK
ncbi:hypothetical protein IA57_04730 [Mangrovimonas yunxiaonensis]|uniref:Uncharacterized protein n=1 Tax=Mangrovimonas yunxiaonensis TaxID=1197477 RepID=A0A084TKA6_9FLAO|nr:hypothetical protein [Mangrovimonas yunxiaonensis]KFB01142.1 hypothetical protein IA57_04730 [Mangrovimonas yunxiaonensis]GGH38415.1 hypothetical protein GCM10011364_07170 [Mangrovimonas yunxiaonensis]